MHFKSISLNQDDGIPNMVRDPFSWKEMKFLLY